MTEKIKRGKCNFIQKSFYRIGFTLKVNPPLCSRYEISDGKCTNWLPAF